MKFVLVGILGIMATAAAAYLYFVPFHEVANEATVAARQASEELGAILGISEPRIKGPVEAEDAAAQPKPSPTDPRSRGQRNLASSAKAGQVLPALPPEPAPPVLREESLSLKTLDSDSFNETRIEVHPSGRRTVIRLKDGEVVDVVDIPE